jgi:hypothetical protein
LSQDIKQYPKFPQKIKLLPWIGIQTQSYFARAFKKEFAKTQYAVFTGINAIAKTTIDLKNI